MKTFSIDDIRSWQPCYDPARHLADDWQGTAIDILKHETIPPADKLWVVCREELIDARMLRLFAIWCARQVQHLMTDERSIAALDVAERFANGEATQEELKAARDAAREATREAAWDAAREAAGAAAGEAAREAAWNAARKAAREAAGEAAREAAGEAAWKAAREAAWEAQIKHLIEMLEEEGAE
jgi:hypothetical protein